MISGLRRLLWIFQECDKKASWCFDICDGMIYIVVSGFLNYLFQKGRNCASFENNVNLGKTKFLL